MLIRAWIFWLLLALPAVTLAAGFVSRSATAESLLHPSGEFAARFLIVAMMIAPLQMLFHGAAWTRWLARRRRALGVAAFGYATLHTLLYIIDMRSLNDMLAELWAIGIWTGWVALAILAPLAATSNVTAMRMLRRAWKGLHRMIYPAALLTLLHWIYVHNNIEAALVNFAPLAVLESYRVVVLLRRRASIRSGEPDRVSQAHQTRTLS